MRIAMLAPISWRTPPRHYGPWEQVTSLLTEALVARGVDVTLFATLDSRTAGRLDGVCPSPYSEDDNRSVVYLGPVGGAARAKTLGSAHALLHLINFDEPFCLSVVEALACGTPVIACNRGSMRELIDDGVTGFLVDSLDAAVAAIGRIGEIDRATCRAAVSARFTVDRMADR